MEKQTSLFPERIERETEIKTEKESEPKQMNFNLENQNKETTIKVGYKLGINPDESYDDLGVGYDVSSDDSMIVVSSSHNDYKQIKNNFLKCRDDDIEFVKKDLKESGFKEENIKIKFEPITKEDIEKQRKRIEKKNRDEKEKREREIKDYSEKLKGLLKKKFGYNVKLQILKDE